MHLEKSDEKLQLLSSKMRKYYKQLSSEIFRLEEEWKSMTFGEASHAKEREIMRLKVQIKELDDYISAKERQQADSFPSLFNAPSRILLSKILLPISSKSQLGQYLLPLLIEQGKILNLQNQKRKKPNFPFVFRRICQRNPIFSTKNTYCPRTIPGLPGPLFTICHRTSHYLY